MITVRKNTKKEIDRVVRNFNQKIRRLEKMENYDKSILPEKVTTKKIISSVENRNELVRNLRELKRFSRRGSETKIYVKGEDTTKWQYDVIKNRVSSAKRKVSRDITKLETTKITISGREQKQTLAQTNTFEYNNLIAKRNALKKQIDKMSLDELEKLSVTANRILSPKINKQFKGNFIKMLEDIAYLYYYPIDKINEIKSKISKLSHKEFHNLYLQERMITNLLFYYPRKSDVNRYAKAVIEQQNKSEIFEIIDGIYNAVVNK